MIYSFYFKEKIGIPSKKNNKQIIYVAGSPVIISSKGFAAFEKWAVPMMKLNYLKHTAIKEPVKINFTLGTNDGYRRDIDNAVTSLLDCLVKAGVLDDDSTSIVKEIHAKHSTEIGFSIEIFSL